MPETILSMMKYSAISISESHNNQIFNNTISNSGVGINLKNSTSNKIYDNTIINSTKGIDTSAAGGVSW